MTDESTACVICGSAPGRSVFSIRPSVSTDRRVIDVPADNWFCDACGTVWNMAGARAQAPAFYAEQYDLHGESALSEWQLHLEGGARGESDAILDFVEKSSFPESGSVLEIGCGKGVFIGKFLRKHPGWVACAVEPSANATHYFRQILPDVEIHEGTLETSPFLGRTFDFVAVSGVLEHVLDPPGFLEGVKRAVAPGGRLYNGVPNFVPKPDDLLVFDHLTRFTPDTLDALYRRTGLQLERRDARTDRVWLWDMLRLGEGEAAESNATAVGAAQQLVDAHIAAVRTGFEAFERMLTEASPGETLAIFGLGVQGLLARSIAGETARGVRYILDDNPFLWGTRKEGLEIWGSQDIPRLGIDRLFLAANPCYHIRMRDKAVALGLSADRVYS